MRFLGVVGSVQPLNMKYPNLPEVLTSTWFYSPNRYPAATHRGVWCARKYTAEKKTMTSSLGKVPAPTLWTMVMKLFRITDRKALPEIAVTRRLAPILLWGSAEGGGLTLEGKGEVVPSVCTTLRGEQRRSGHEGCPQNGPWTAPSG